MDQILCTGDGDVHKINQTLAPRGFIPSLRMVVNSTGYIASKINRGEVIEESLAF